MTLVPLARMLHSTQGVVRRQQGLLLRRQDRRSPCVSAWRSPRTACRSTAAKAGQQVTRDESGTLRRGERCDGIVGKVYPIANNPRSVAWPMRGRTARPSGKDTAEAAPSLTRKRPRRTGVACKFRYNFKLLHEHIPGPDGTRQELRAPRHRIEVVPRCGKRAAISSPSFAPRAGLLHPLPPPNVTGTLHMGHAFQQWNHHGRADPLPPDEAASQHAVALSAPTTPASLPEIVVENTDCAPQGTSRAALGREVFVERVWAWKEESGSTITRQMRRLPGASGESGRDEQLHDGRRASPPR